MIGDFGGAILECSLSGLRIISNWVIYRENSLQSWVSLICQAKLDSHASFNLLVKPMRVEVMIGRGFTIFNCDVLGQPRNWSYCWQTIIRKIRKPFFYVYIILCLSVCLSVSKYKTFWGNSRDPRSGLWMLRITKICLF